MSTTHQSSFHYTRTSPHATPLFRAHPTDAGWDISYYDTTDAVILPGQTCWLGTGITVAIPFGYYARVAPRSGLAFRHSLNVLAGVIDSGYRGEIRVGLINHGQDPVTIAVGDRIAQLIITQISVGDAIETDSLHEADRGAAGFGSTGAQ